MRTSVPRYSPVPTEVVRELSESGDAAPYWMKLVFFDFLHFRYRPVLKETSDLRQRLKALNNKSQVSTSHNMILLHISL